jgi:transcription antitermination protein NusB
MARKQAREAAMALVYEWDAGGTGENDTVDTMMDELSLSTEDKAYAMEVFGGIKAHIEDIDERIGRVSKGWRVERMPRVDLSILRVAVYELLHREDIPKSVAANEAVEMAKAYSGEKSAPFINGILGSLIRELEPGDTPQL